MTADLAEEHSTAVLATERLETEQADRMKLEKERGELQVLQIDIKYFVLRYIKGEPKKTSPPKN